MGTSLLFRARGYVYYQNELPYHPHLGYWYRAPSIAASDVPPLMVIHGIGSILSLIWFVTNLATRAQDRHIFVLDIGHISMRLPRPTQFPSPTWTTSQLCNILDHHVPNPSKEPTKAVIFGHSLGSALTVWLLKSAPDRLAGLVLCDPVSLLLQYSDVAYNFVYRPSVTAAQIFFEWIAKEPGIASTLGRNFHWFDNVFPMIAGEGDADGEMRFFPEELETVVFLSEKDCIVPTGKIYDFLTRNRMNVAIHIMPELDHGGFLFDNYWLDLVLDTFVQMNTGLKDGIRGDI
jgi:pimeloyl-ACP methyl ester carboxylesterase